MAKATDSGAEKRIYPRLQINARVEGLWASPGGEERSFQALLVHVSEGGALLRCVDPLAVNCTAQLFLKVDPSTTLKPRGRVRWWRRNGEVREVGLEFDKPVRALGRFVEARLEEQRPASSRRR